MSGKKSNLISRLPSDLLSEQAFQAPANGVVAGCVSRGGGLLVCFPQALEGCSLLSPFICSSVQSSSCLHDVGAPSTEGDL